MHGAERGAGQLCEELLGNIPSPKKNGDRICQSYAADGSLEVEDFSTSKSLKAVISVVEDHGGPEPCQFEPRVQPEAGALRVEALQKGKRGWQQCRSGNMT